MNHGIFMTRIWRFIMGKNKEVFNKLKGGLIVSCQALRDEPLFSSYIMSRMAVAAKEGGACGIRANTPEDIIAIKQEVELPIIGLYKQEFEDSEVYITPTLQAVDDLMKSKPDIIAIDATNRLRPGGETLEHFFELVKKKYPDMLFMADCATYEEGLYASKLGFDCVGTTLCGYTANTIGTTLPNIELMQRLAQALEIPVIAEGGIWSPIELKQAINSGVHAAVVGTAITRPRDITKKFVSAIV